MSADPASPIAPPTAHCPCPTPLLEDSPLPGRTTLGSSGNHTSRTSSTGCCSRRSACLRRCPHRRSRADGQTMTDNRSAARCLAESNCSNARSLNPRRTARGHPNGPNASYPLPRLGPAALLQHLHNSLACAGPGRRHRTRRSPPHRTAPPPTIPLPPSAAACLLLGAWANASRHPVPDAGAPCRPAS